MPGLGELALSTLSTPSSSPLSTLTSFQDSAVTASFGGISLTRSAAHGSSQTLYNSLLDYFGFGSTLETVTTGVGNRGTSFLKFSKPFWEAKASNTYLAGENPSYTAERGLDPGGGYWVSDGQHGADEIISYQANLRHRHRGSGIRVNWAYAPGLVRVRVSGDGTHFEDSICWKKQREGTEEVSLEFDRPRNIQAVRIDMKKPYGYKFFGINQVALWS